MNRLFLFQGHLGGYYDQCISLFQQAGFSPKVIQKASQKQTILGLVSAGMGSF